MDEAWEGRCLRCGRCCFEKEMYEGEVYYTGEPCEFLDVQTRLCTVYSKRHVMRPGCVPLTPRVLAMGVLPADCPYVSDREGYRSPHLCDQLPES